MSSAVQFPNSPKLGRIPLPPYIVSQREKIEQRWSQRRLSFDNVLRHRISH